jgi:hypothetical protein
VDVDRGQLVWRRSKDVAIVMDLHEIGPVGGRTTGGRDGRRFEQFVEVREQYLRMRFTREDLTPLKVTAVAEKTITFDIVIDQSGK